MTAKQNRFKSPVGKRTIRKLFPDQRFTRVQSCKSNVTKLWWSFNHFHG